MNNSTANWTVKGMLLAVFAAFCIYSFFYPPKARIIPLIITISGLIAAIIDLLIPQKEAIISDNETEKADKVDKTLQHSELATWAWIGLYFGLIVFSGLIFGSSLFLLFFLKWFWKEKWREAILVSVLTGFGIYLLFHGAFQMELYRGIFFEI